MMNTIAFNFMGEVEDTLFTATKNREAPILPVGSEIHFNGPTTWNLSDLHFEIYKYTFTGSGLIKCELWRSSDAPIFYMRGKLDDRVEELKKMGWIVDLG